MAQTKGILERVFKLSEKGTTVKTEILAGLTTFVAMAYIIFVNPSILADAGIPKEAAIAATVWSAVIGSAAMGLWANFPVAVAPGMGLNAFFAYTSAASSACTGPWPSVRCSSPASCSCC